MRALLGVLGAIFVLGALAATGWCAWSYVGPYRWLAEAQLSVLGSYEIRLTFLFTLLFWLMPALFVMVPLRMALGTDRAAGIDGHAVAFWLQNNRGSMVLGVIALVGLGGSAFCALDALTIGEHAEASLGSLEAGLEPPSRWVTVRGTPLRDRALSIEDDGMTTYYVPVVLGAPMRPAVFVEVSEYEVGSPELMGGSYEGLLSENGLPGLVRAELERGGAIAPRHYLLDWHATPSQRWGMAVAFGIFGAFGLVVLVLVRLWVRLRGA